MKNYLQKIVGLLGVVFFAWFAIPVPLGIINIGNETGMSVSALMIWLGFRRAKGNFDRSSDGSLNKSLAHMIESTRPDAEKEKMSLIVRIGWILLVLAFAAAGLLSLLMLRAATKKPADDATVVVLGCRVYGEEPSLMLVKRLEAAHSYLMAHPTASCVLSGGRGNGEDISEAEAMYRWMLAHGIEQGRMFKEERSGSTRENLQFSAEIIESQGLNTGLAIVTDGFHEYRAGVEARRLGLDFGSVPASSPWWLFPTFVVREYYGIIYSWFTH